MTKSVKEKYSRIFKNVTSLFENTEYSIDITSQVIGYGHEIIGGDSFGLEIVFVIKDDFYALLKENKIKKLKLIPEYDDLNPVMCNYFPEEYGECNDLEGSMFRCSVVTTDEDLAQIIKLYV